MRFNLIFMFLIFTILINAVEKETDLELMDYDYTCLNDSILFKYPLTDVKENKIAADDPVYDSKNPMLFCIVTPYSCSSCNESIYPLINEFTEIDSARTCFILENHYFRDTYERLERIKPSLEKSTRILFDTEGRNAELLKLEDTKNNFFFVVTKKSKIIKVIGFADHIEYNKSISVYLKEIYMYWSVD